MDNFSLFLQVTTHKIISYEVACLMEKQLVLYHLNTYVKTFYANANKF